MSKKFLSIKQNFLYWENEVIGLQLYTLLNWYSDNGEKNLKVEYFLYSIDNGEVSDIDFIERNWIKSKEDLKRTINGMINFSSNWLSDISLQPVEEEVIDKYVEEISKMYSI